MPKNFTWKKGDQLPRIEQHSIRKLDVIRQYLDDYFDTVVPNPATDTLNITLVDGFCGGGAYSGDHSIVFGSPIVLLDAVKDAENRINQNREKPLTINAKFYFIDSEVDHIESLKEQVRSKGYSERFQDSIEYAVGEFADHLPSILNRIKVSQRKGRSIFILDQFGYSDVPMESLQSIFSSLDRAEVILTFAIDSLLNYLHEESSALDLYRQFGVDERFIQEWQANKADENLGRLITQRSLISRLQRFSGAEFFTPFMLWSRTDNRWMMLAHLSRHQAARDKMLDVHWNIQNSFAHFGRGSLFSLGYDPRLLESRDSLFSFSETDRKRLGYELDNELPREVIQLMVNGRLSIGTLLQRIGNRTAATNNDLFVALMTLAQNRDIQVLSSTGRIKRPDTKIIVSDTLILPDQPRFI